MNVEKTSVTLEASAFSHFLTLIRAFMLRDQSRDRGIKCQPVWREKCLLTWFIATKDRVFLPQKVTPNCQLKRVPDSSINSTEEGPKNSEHFRRMGADVYLFIWRSVHATCSYYRFFSVCRNVDLPEFGSTWCSWTLLVTLFWTFLDLFWPRSVVKQCFKANPCSRDMLRAWPKRPNTFLLHDFIKLLKQVYPKTC